MKIPTWNLREGQSHWWRFAVVLAILAGVEWCVLEIWYHGFTIESIWYLILSLEIINVVDSIIGVRDFLKGSKE